MVFLTPRRNNGALMTEGLLLLLLLCSTTVSCSNSLQFRSKSSRNHVRGAQRRKEQQQRQYDDPTVRRAVLETILDYDTTEDIPGTAGTGKAPKLSKVSTSYEFEVPATLAPSPEVVQANEAEGDEVEAKKEPEEEGVDEYDYEYELEEEEEDQPGDKNKGDEEDESGTPPGEDYWGLNPGGEDDTDPPGKINYGDDEEEDDENDEDGPVESAQAEPSGPETHYWHINDFGQDTIPPSQSPTVYDPSTNYWHINDVDEENVAVQAEERTQAPTRSPTIDDPSTNYWHINDFDEEDEEQANPPSQSPTNYDPGTNYWHINDFDKEEDNGSGNVESAQGRPTKDPQTDYWHINDFDEGEEEKEEEGQGRTASPSKYVVVSHSEEDGESDPEATYWHINDPDGEGKDEQDGEEGEEQVVEAALAAEKTGFYYQDLIPFSVLVKGDEYVTDDLGIPLFLLLEMSNTLTNLVNIHITNLTVHMSVDYPQDRRLAEDHYHMSSMYFEGSAEFGSETVHAVDAVQEVQASLLADKSKLQDFWDSESPGMDHSIEVLDISPLIEEPDESRQGEQKEQEQQLSTSGVKVTDRRDSNVWVIVGVVVPFVAICICVICLAGRIRFIAKGAQERYNQKYGLYGYEGYGQNISKEDIFKEEYLIPSEHEHSHSQSHSSIDFLVHPIKAVKRLSKVRKAPIPLDEISTEEDEGDDEVQGAFPTERKRDVSRNGKEDTYNAPSAPAEELQNGGEHSLSNANDESKEVFANEDYNNLASTENLNENGRVNNDHSARSETGEDLEIFTNEDQAVSRLAWNQRRFKKAQRDDGGSVSSGRTRGSSVSSGRKTKSFDDVSSTGSFYSCRSGRSGDDMM